MRGSIPRRKGALGAGLQRITGVVVLDDDDAPAALRVEAPLDVHGVGELVVGDRDRDRRPALVARRVGRVGGTRRGRCVRSQGLGRGIVELSGRRIAVADGAAAVVVDADDARLGGFGVGLGFLLDDDDVDRLALVEAFDVGQVRVEDRRPAHDRFAAGCVIGFAGVGFGTGRRQVSPGRSGS